MNEEGTIPARVEREGPRPIQLILPTLLERLFLVPPVTALEKPMETVDSQANQMRRQEERLEALTDRVRTLERRLQINDGRESAGADLERHTCDETRVGQVETGTAEDKVVVDTGTGIVDEEAPMGAATFLPMPWS
ncbi:hypothetical protein GGS21DRAFT_492115 [Xylaria nigripes]|nr:hypothetical protein GGS21DRAFT_492115 [Xylaria nigripes]